MNAVTQGLKLNLFRGPHADF